MQQLSDNLEYIADIKEYKGFYILDSNEPNIIYLRKLSDEEASTMKEFGYHIYENPKVKVDIYG